MRSSAASPMLGPGDGRESSKVKAFDYGLALPVVLALVAGTASAQVTVRDPGSFVVDKANLVDEPAQRELEGWLRELEQKTGAQVKLLTVTTTDGEPVFNFAHRHAELWKLGQKGKDNGGLAVVALQEREFRFHTGYGLEHALPDSWIGALTRGVIVPHFQKENYSAGLRQAMIAVANRVADDAKVKLTGMPDYRYVPERSRRGPANLCGVGVVPVIIIILLLTARRRRRRRYWRRWGGGLGDAIFWGSVLNNLGRGGRTWGGGFGGGGFGGGGFGGSFGGGGRFGGGGGGGRW